MDAGWQPNAQGLHELIQLLALTQSPDTAIQHEVHQRLATMRSFAEYDRYLVYIYTQMKDQPEYIRTVAGLILKNNVREGYKKMTAETKQILKQEAVKCLADPIVAIRRTAGTIITTVIEKARSIDKEFPGLIRLFIQLLDSNDVKLIDGTLSALSKICIDSSDRIEEEDEAAGFPLAELIPRLLMLFQSEHEAFRKLALECVNQFIVSMPDILEQQFEVYMRGLFHLVADPSADVKVLVVQAFITLVEVQFERVEQYRVQVLQCILMLNKDDDDSVQLESCEFWPAIAEARCWPEFLISCLPNILPVLMESMMYSDEEASIIEEDEATPKVEDMRPFIHLSKRGEDDADVSEWNLRKCAAAALDVFSVELGPSILPTLLPLLQRALQEEVSWELREAAILALGAVAEGCGPELEAHLPLLVPYLFNQMNHPKLFVRSITCWSICRYVHWIIEQPDAPPQPPLIAQLLSGLLQRLADPSKRVQESALSALATLEEAAQHHLIPYLTPILQTYMAAYSKYQGKNLLVLYDAIGSLAAGVGSALNQPEYVALLLPPLIHTWNSLPDDDIRLFPLLECLAPVVSAIGLGFSQFAPPVYQRCLKLIHITLTAEAQQDVNVPDKDFIVCSLDLISGLVEGLKEHAPSLLQDTALFPLLEACIKNPANDVRQSGFALIGEMSKHCLAVLGPHLAQYLPIMADNLQPELYNACNNACWALGEIAMRLGGQMEVIVDAVLPRLIRMINATYVSRGLVENAAFTLGRLGGAVPHKVAPHLAEFISPWCQALRAVKDDAEKDSAFRGMCILVQVNPNVVLEYFPSLADAIASWAQPSTELKQIFANLLQSLKAYLGAERFAQVAHPCPEALKIFLAEQYSV